MSFFKNKKFKILFCTLLSFFIFSGATLAATGTKNLSALYKNIKVYVNGKRVSIKGAEEPFIVGGRTYVPLRIVSQSLKAQVDWDSKTNSVKIEESPELKEKIAQLEAELKEKTKENKELQSELNKALKEIKKINTDDLSKVEKTLNDDFYKLQNIRVEDIKIVGDKSQVNVTVYFKLDKTNKNRWKDLKNKDIETYIEEMVKKIQKDFKKSVIVNGELVDSYNTNKTLLKFEKNKSKNLEIEYRDRDYRSADTSEVAENLKGEIFYIAGYKFQITSIAYDTKKDDINVEINDASKKMNEDLWSELRRREIEDGINLICEKLVREFEYEADVRVDEINLQVYDKGKNHLERFKYYVSEKRLR